jgi:hypothetical protein
MHSDYIDSFKIHSKLFGKALFLKCLFLLFSNILFVPKSHGQSVTPFIFNNVGGFSPNMEWNIGEGVSVSSFKSSNGLSLNTGGLQPLTSIVTSINEYGPAVFGEQITIGPNPAVNLLRIKAGFNEVGNLSLQLLDAKSAIVFTKEAGTIFYHYDTDLLLGQYPSGIYYIRVYFKPNTGYTKIGIYKIIKL